MVIIWFSVSVLELFWFLLNGWHCVCIGLLDFGVELARILFFLFVLN